MSSSPPVGPTTSPASDETVVENIQSKDESRPSAPPSLGYSVREHRAGLIISLLLLVILNACAPVLVYYLVKHYGNVTTERLYGVTTAVLANSPPPGLGEPTGCSEGEESEAPYPNPRQEPSQSSVRTQNGGRSLTFSNGR